MPITFFGGIAPKNKKYSNKRPLQRLSPRYVYLPFEEGYSLAVSISSNVLKGQTLAHCESRIVVASVSGVFKGIVKDGEKRYIAIENDKTGTPHTELKPVNKPLKELRIEEIHQLLTYFGIFDSSDGVFAREKLPDPKNDKARPIKRLIINCTEHDSYNTALRKLIEEKSRELVGGAKILMHALGAKKSIFVVESGFVGFGSLIKEHINDPSMFTIAKMKRKYPINEKTIISSIYGREIPRGKRTVDIGYSVFGAEAVVNIFKSFVTGMPQVDKTVTASGEGIKKPSNFIVPIGTPISTITKSCKGMKHSAVDVIDGGIMDGKIVSESIGIVTESTNQILYLNKVDKPKAQSCVKCGRCIDVCPMFLSPLDFAVAYQKKKRRSKHFYGVNACIECGCCEYICPRDINLLEIIRKVKRPSSKRTGVTEKSISVDIEMEDDDLDKTDEGITDITDQQSNPKPEEKQERL